MNLDELACELECLDNPDLLLEIERLWRAKGKNTADREVEFALCFAELRRRLALEDKP